MYELRECHYSVSVFLISGSQSAISEKKQRSSILQLMGWIGIHGSIILHWEKIS